MRWRSRARGPFTVLCASAVPARSAVRGSVGVADVLTFVQRGFTAMVCAVALVGCAVPEAPRGEVGRYKLALPEPSRWTEIPVGQIFQAPPAVAGEPGALPLRTRAWGLAGADGAWQAVALLHVGDAARSTAPSWAGVCPQQLGVLVEDAAAGSATRIDCLRLRRWATVDHWLERQRPDLAGWAQQQALRLGGSPALVSHMLTSAGGELVMLDVLVDQALVRPETRGNDAFLRAGLPAQAWSERVAQAVRQATGMVDGHLALPPFPFVSHLSPSPVPRTSP